MPLLDHKIPPPVVGLACAALAWFLASHTPQLTLEWHFRYVLVVLVAALGVGIDLWGLIAFRMARTTVNPLAPGRSNSVVRTGPYRFTRNPMYLGMALLLLAWCIHLRNPLAPLSILAFFVYIIRFQIIPEERALLAKFGDAYAAYLSDVRRWL
ncbi:methyltransferase family protein [Sterolibacterium denitrificans]|nr:isoprenylcysteine carboxylmethyltransferase family protein [Sterolibacterium denitrificans]